MGSVTIESTGKPIYYDDYTLVTKIFKNAYFHIFGELFIDEKYDPQEPDECKQTLSRPGPGVTCPDYVRLISFHPNHIIWKTCYVYKDFKNIFQGVMAIVMLSLYMVVITLIFLNVLIAMFSEGLGFTFTIYKVT